MTIVRKLCRWFIIGALAQVLATVLFPAAHAQTYNRFTPADGILVGDPSTYVTTAAAASDVISLWSGTCDASTFLRADGACAAALSGTVAVTQGGTGATSLSGLLLGNGTSPVTSAAASDVISLWSGTCDASTFLRADGACEPAGGSPAGADTQVQFNSAGAFAADVDFAWNAGTLNVGGVNGNGFIYPNARPVSGAGRSLSIRGGAATTGSGGGLNLSGGAAAGGLGTGGDVLILGGAGQVTRSGHVTIQAGNSSIAGVAGGDAYIRSGNSYTSGDSNAGSTVVQGNDATGSGNGNGGNLTLRSGSGKGTGTNGFLRLQTPAGNALQITGDGAWNLGIGLDPGTAGQVLTSNGAGTPPTWQAGGGGGVSLSGTNVWTGANTWSGDYTTPRMVAKGAGTGATNIAYLQFADSAGTQIGYVGDNSTGSSDIAVQASTSGANINLVPGATSGSVISTVGTSAASFDARRAGDAPYYAMSTTGGTQLGYVQANDSTNLVELANLQSGGNINLLTSGGGSVTVNSVPVATVSENLNATHTTNGFSSLSSDRIDWIRIGRQVCIFINIIGTSNATTLTVSDGTWPAPALTFDAIGVIRVNATSTGSAARVTVNGAGGLTFSADMNSVGGGWTASGTKSAQGSFCYVSSS